jgi:hypothetical protein
VAFSDVHSLANGPITFLLDGKQYLVVGAVDTLYAFARFETKLQN